MSTTHLMACHACDLLQQVPAVPENSAAHCGRCGVVLIQNKTKSLQNPLALLFAAALLFVMFNSFEFLTFKKEGLERRTHVITGVRELSDQGMPELAALVAFTLIIVPGLQLLALLYVLVPVSLNRRVPGMFRVFRYTRLLRPWHMVEIFMLGVLVSMVKVAKMAQIVPGVAVFSLTAFIFVMAAASAAIDPHEVWERWEGER